MELSNRLVDTPTVVHAYLAYNIIMPTRGRGRGRGAFFPDATPPRPPGPAPDNDWENDYLPPPPPTKADPYQMLKDSVARLAPDQTDLEEIYNEVISFAGLDDEKQKQSILILYGRAEEDWHLSTTIARLMNKLAAHSECGHSFRTKLLMTLQKNFTAIDELRSKNIGSYLGCLSMLCQVYCHLRDIHDQPFKPLLDPVLLAIEKLVDNKSTDTELECAALQLEGTGHLVYDYNPARFKTIIQNTRNVITDTRGSKPTREVLLTVVERNAAGWR